MKRPTLSRILAVSAFLGASLTTFTALAEPEWIWLSKNAKSGEKVALRREFEVPGAVKSATLQVTCDNGATAFVNGEKALENPDWQKPVSGDVKALLKAGKNELRLDARNQSGGAAAVAVLTIETTDGKTITIETNGDWQAAPAGSSDFKPAVVIAKYGDGPWGKALAQGGGGKPAKGGDG